ncbi:MAG: egghead [Candidatus Nitrosocaldaceae archaeon]|nr:MAG: egghead [Candidatus Nitrosocaldaceae archaeon]
MLEYIYYLIDILLDLLKTFTELYIILINNIYLDPVGNYITKGIMFSAYFVWSVFSAYYMIGLFAYKRYKPLKDTFKTHAELVIVTVGNNNIKDSLIEAIEENSKFGSINILIEEDAELIDYIRNMNVNIIEVPKMYRNDLIGKGRALNYFAENIAEDNKWYIFLDDDNILLNDDIFYEINIYDRLGYVAANPILVPRISNSKITYIMDWIRYFDDLLVFRTFTGLLKRPLIGLHGEMLTVKGKVLREIGFKDKTLTEDFRFGCELVRKGYKTWQSNTKVSILSPNNIGDLYKQRGRWFSGLIHDVSTSVPLMRIIVLTRLISWILGIFGSWVFAILWILFEPFWYTIVGGVLYWYIYAYGVKRVGDWKFLFLIPIYGILESSSWIKGVGCKEFVVIDKNHIKLDVRT